MEKVYTCYSCPLLPSFPGVGGGMGGCTAAEIFDSPVQSASPQIPEATENIYLPLSKCSYEVVFLHESILLHLAKVKNNCYKISKIVTLRTCRSMLGVHWTPRSF